MEYLDLHGTETLNPVTELLKDRIIFISGDIDDVVSAHIKASLLWLNTKSKEDIIMMIDSPGGDVYSAMSIVDTMKYIDCDVQTICAGTCDSAAAIILSAGTKGKRYSMPHSEIMIHEVSQPITVEKPSEIREELKPIERANMFMSKILAENTKKPLLKIQGDIKKKDFFMTPAEAKVYGLIDSVVGDNTYKKQKRTKKVKKLVLKRKKAKKSVKKARAKKAMKNLLKK